MICMRGRKEPRQRKREMTGEAGPAGWGRCVSEQRVEQEKLQNRQ